MRLKKREIPNSRREMNDQEGDGVKKRDQEGDGVKKRESPS